MIIVYQIIYDYVWLYMIMYALYDYILFLNYFHGFTRCRKPPEGFWNDFRRSLGWFTMILGRLWFFTLRACPPTHLHAAQFLRSAAYSRRNFLSAQFPFFLANRGGPRGGPRTPFKGPRAKGPTRPKGPSGPLGPFGAQGGRLYAAYVIPNGINNTQRKPSLMESIQGK